MVLSYGHGRTNRPVCLGLGGGEVVTTSKQMRAGDLVYHARREVAAVLPSLDTARFL